MWHLPYRDRSNLGDNPLAAANLAIHEVEKESSELAEHFANFAVVDMMIQIIDYVKLWEDEALSILEGYWQHFKLEMEILI